MHIAFCFWNFTLYHIKYCSRALGGVRSLIHCFRSLIYYLSTLQEVEKITQFSRAVNNHSMRKVLCFNVFITATVPHHAACLPFEKILFETALSVV